jgi:nucleoside-triphosphatase THEP1
MTIKRRGCTAETRQTILADLQDWARDPDGAKVYWMNGMAGTGKTTIVYSLCEWLEANRQLGANFCCSRLSSSCRNVNDIMPTLAYQLARYSPAIRSALCKILEEEPDAGKLNVEFQFAKLVLEPMQNVKDAIPEGVVVAIDALDECEDNYGVRLVLGTLLKFASNIPVKFFITSRPEPTIRDKMLARDGSPSVLYLHEIERSIVKEDIKKYLTEVLSSVSPPLSIDKLEQLANRAGNLFIYAATAARYICPDNIRVDSHARLQTTLTTKTELASGDARVSTKQYKELDELYTSILAAAFDPELEEEERRVLEIVLRTAISVMEPMTPETLASVLNLDKEKVEIALDPLRSVLNVPEGGGLVSVLHASFPDYMVDQLRAKSFYCDNSEHGEFLANRCFDVMKTQLRFNICNLESSFVFDKNVVDLAERIKSSISAALSYSCRYWGEHLRQGGATEVVHRNLVDFLTYRLLFWMEVLNLERHMALAGEILGQVRDWIVSE